MYIIVILVIIILVLNKLNNKKEYMVNINTTSYMGMSNLLSLKNNDGMISPNINAKDIITRKMVVRKKINAIPSGIIIVWSGSLEDIPYGWALCNGQNGTPDLRGKFILSYNNSIDVKDASNNSLTQRKIGDTGGSEKHKLSIDEMPKHYHNIGKDWYDGGGKNAGGYDLGSGGKGDIKTGTTTRTTYVGDNKEHNNMPPFYTLAYIIKL